MAVDPPKKRGRPSKIPSPQIGEEDVTAGLKGKAVLVPSSALAALTSVHGPNTYLRGQIKGRDSGHKDCVLIKCREDPRTFYFDIGQVQAWLEEQEQKGPVAAQNADMPLGKELEQPRSGRGQSNKCARVEHATSEGPPIGPPKKGMTKKAEVADLTGKEVDVPGAVFNNHTPGLSFRAYIMGPDSGHASAVVLRMIDNSRSRYYFHASEVRGWLRMMELRALAEDDSGMDEQDTLDDAFAAEVLAHMSTGGSSAPPSPSSSINTMQPAVRSPVSQPQAQPEQQVALPVSGAVGYASAPASISRRTLHWGPTEVIAQRPSLLPRSLAEQLVRITSQHDSTVGAMAALEAAAVHVEGSLHAGEQQSKEGGNWQHRLRGQHSENEEQQQQQQQG